MTNHKYVLTEEEMSKLLQDLSDQCGEIREDELDETDESDYLSQVEISDIFQNKNEKLLIIRDICHPISKDVHSLQKVNNKLLVHFWGF
ncbi:hypothetical protein TNCV_3640121 [Trichonephila clavipes]|nr:hypothetical protein TNCV_3640121 [Trichonephila clavipes]